MPTYSLRQHDNGVFYIHWTDGRRSRRESTGQKEETQAQIYLGEWLKGEAADKAGIATVFHVSDLWELYYERHVEKNNASATVADSVWSNLKPHFGALTLPEVTARGADGYDKVEKYIKLRAAGKIGRKPATSGTIRHELARLKACFAWCAAPKQKIIGLADVPVFGLPPDSQPRDRWLRLDEIKKMYTSAESLRDGTRLPRIERFLYLALETASRSYAILQLTWDRVDFEIGVIHYNVPGRKRTKKRRASVPISKRLLPILRRAHAERETEYVCDNLTRNMWAGIDRIARHAGLTGVGPHVLRHTAATHMLRNGVPIWQVAGVLGDTVATVEKVYGHHVPDGLRGAVDMIGGLLEPTK